MLQIRPVRHVEVVVIQELLPDAGSGLSVKIFERGGVYRERKVELAEDVADFGLEV